MQKLDRIEKSVVCERKVVRARAVQVRFQIAHGTFFDATGIGADGRSRYAQQCVES